MQQLKEVPLEFPEREIQEPTASPQATLNEHQAQADRDTDLLVPVLSQG